VYRDRSVCVVIPAFNEEALVGRVISTLPLFVDHVVVVDDFSTDKTKSVVRRLQQDDPKPERIVLIEHSKNSGVGAAIISGYEWARDNRVDFTAVMAGDAQMDPADLPGLLDEAIDHGTDYVKGNRLFSGEAWQIIPRHRYLGNAALSMFTKIASGYWHVADSQTGFTVINHHALSLLPLRQVYPSYGMPNDLLVRLNIFDLRVRDVPIRPVYNVGERSRLRVYKVIFTISLLLARLFVHRMIEKYIIRDFHPLIFFYLLGFILAPIGGGLGVYLVITRALGHGVATTSALFASLLLISGLQFLLFGMWFDMERNKDLR